MITEGWNSRAQKGGSFVFTILVSHVEQFQFYSVGNIPYKTRYRFDATNKDDFIEIEFHSTKFTLNFIP